MERGIKVWKLCLVLGVAAIAAQVTTPQTSSGNILTGDVKAEVVRQYSGTLPRPEGVLIHDFAVPVGGVTTDESIAGRLHRDIKLRHGVDEDSSPEVLTRRVQAAFTKTLAEELKKVDMPVADSPPQSTLVAEGPAGPDLVIDGQFIAIREGDAPRLRGTNSRSLTSL